MEKSKIINPIRNIVVSYFIFGIFWILFSDILSAIIIEDLGFYQKFQSIKGIVFIFATGIFLFFLLKSNLKELEEKEEKLYRQAYFDSLTSLPNRRSLYKKLREKINFIEKLDRSEVDDFSLFYLNLKNIDNLTEIKGHTRGSDLIKKIALHLKDSMCTKNKKCTIYNYNYDQFVLLFEDLKDKQSIKEAAKNILVSIENLWNQSEIDYYVTLDIGISKFPDSGKDPEALISAAQLAAHNVDSNDKSFQIYDQQMYLDKLEYENLKSDLRSAVKNNEFKLYYQPKIKTDDNTISGVEALIRWEHPSLGLVSPQKFIKIAEESALIIEIGDWVIEKSFQQLLSWQNKYNSDLSISINLSPIELYDENKTERIRKISQKYKIRKELVEFEITENALLDYRGNTIKILNKIKNLGFSIALDDFGIGYSSLSYLSRLPIDTLKIDKSFTGKLADSKNMILIESIINLSHKMNLKVIAEGVETSEQLKKMNELKCDEIQGYYFYKALPVDQLEKIFKENNL
jgi:diguanylate cyclase (GGDEF)-like protein